MNLIKIIDLTEQLGISSRSLRYYEQVGLIRSVRPEHEKYRFFDLATVERLKQIMVLRKMQIPIKDIIRIFESEDMSVVVQVFVDRVNAIEDEVNALSELKRIVNDFLQAMMRNGVKKISAIPLLYEEMNKQLESCETSAVKSVTYQELSAISERASGPMDIRLIELPAMRVLSSFTKESSGTQSDADGFWQWIHRQELPLGTYGSHELFEYQEAGSYQPVTILRVQDDFVNDSRYVDFAFAGGLFAVCGLYTDDDIGACQNAVIRSFDNNRFFQVDYLHSGMLRHETLIETVISPDMMREKIEILVPMKKRAVDVFYFPKEQQTYGIRLDEILRSNKVLREIDIDLNKVTPILDPYYRINELGEAEYRSSISERVLSTNEKVKIPFRVDITFKTNEASVRLYHGKAAVIVNAGNVFDMGETWEELGIKEPVFGTENRLRGKGSVHKNEYNTLTWIVGETHFAVIVNDEIRYCGVKHPYMRLDPNRLDAYPVIIGSNSSDLLTIRSVSVSKIQPGKAVKIKEGELAIMNRQSNNVLPDLHMYMVDYFGQNYSLDGCMAYLMECLGEDKEAFDYWFFSGLTGDNLTQVYCHDYRTTCFCLSAVSDKAYIKGLFDACGYEHTYVTCDELNANKEMYLRTLIAYIDKGVPVIARLHAQNQTDNTYYALICGYEEHGKALLYLFDNSTEPERFDVKETIDNDWIFAGAKKKAADVAALYRKVVLDMPKLLAKPKTCQCTFGAQAFLDWAKDIENGRFDDSSPDQFNQWRDHTTYVCILATNGSCLEFLNRALQYHPDMSFIERIINQYKKMAELWKELDAVGGGFNVTLEALKDRVKRKTIADKIREFSTCYENILGFFSEFAQ